ncbi:MAG TPA: COX15/CtaA family protein [Rhodocyclaceae bacterium]|nr:COX15/CtaA family protein [Rhodocyclaceae bacterium]
MKSLSLSSSTAGNRPVAIWLLICCAMVFCTLIVGGVTRLTESGLSIVEWQPLLGAIPPLTHEEWLIMFEKYKQIPQFHQVNFDMTLEGFQYIFWWEWVHRQIGRVIGMVFFLPLVWFWVRGMIPRGYKLKLVVFLILGGLQGAMGWYMVKSGLVNDVRVSQFRLTAHLGLAFLIFGLMFWTALGLLQERLHQPHTPAAVRKFALRVLVLVCIMVLSGGFVAGIRAGHAYNTFPLMNDSLIPDGLFAMEPWWINFFSNLTTVQFDHRMIAWSLMVLVPLLWWKVLRHAPQARGAANAMLAMLAVQVVLGISTLLHHVPVPLAAMHQAGAMILFAKLLLVNHKLRTY